MPPEAFRPWALLNGVAFHEVKTGAIEGRGSALLASKAVTNSAEGAECLLTVPKDLILSQERVMEHAKADRDFREVLESLGDFGRVGLSSGSFCLQSGNSPSVQSYGSSSTLLLSREAACSLSFLC